MGYTHYYTRQSAILEPTLFAQFAKDCRALYTRAEIPLASWNGRGKPRFTAKEVAFNGVEQCGHPRRDLGITWPAPLAGGVHIPAQPTGRWFAGTQLSQRTCGGDCSHETFRVDQRHTWQPWETRGEVIFSCCKTAYKPYDVLVTGCLIVLKHYFGTEVTITSDGDEHDWDDGRRLCTHVLGYGSTFRLAVDDN